MWVAPCLTDGLGNRLFQYACAKGYSEKYGKPLVFFLPRSRPTGHGSYNNIFKLFPETPILETDVSWNELEENNYYKYELLEYIKDNLVIKGCRQSYNYFENISIKPNFENAISKERLHFLNTTYLSSKENLFFIHVRLGDYMILPHYQIDLASYYTKALQHVPSNAQIVVFSNTPTLAKQMFPNLYVSEITDEIETLYLMSNCLLGSIVANSTFSYWGSYLAHQNNINHISIFPYKLMNGVNGDFDYSTYFPPYAKVLKF